MPFVQTKITSADVRITTGPAIVYGILAAAAGTGGLWQLNDSSNDGGTDIISGFAQPSGETYIDLSNNPVQFHDSVYADVPGTNVILTIFYTE
jgi:hypothetical protein